MPDCNSSLARKEIALSMAADWHGIPGRRTDMPHAASGTTIARISLRKGGGSRAAIQADAA